MVKTKSKLERNFADMNQLQYYVDSHLAIYIGVIFKFVHATLF